MRADSQKELKISADHAPGEPTKSPDAGAKVELLQAALERSEKERRQTLQIAMARVASLETELRNLKSEAAGWDEARRWKLGRPPVSSFLRLPLIRAGRRQTLLTKARRAARLNQWSEASKLFSWALAENGNAPYVWVEYGHALKEDGALIEAARAYRKVLMLMPDHPDISHHLSFVLSKLQSWPALNENYVGSGRFAGGDEASDAPPQKAGEGDILSMEMLDLDQNGRVVLHELEKAIAALPGRADKFSENVGYDYKSPYLKWNGFHGPEDGFRWSKGFRASISFLAHEAVSETGILSIRCGTQGKQRIEVYLNGLAIFGDELDGKHLTLSLPVTGMRPGLNTLEFDLPGAKPPGNGDQRNLALAFLEMKYLPNFGLGSLA
jgi:hypothetical protein